MSSIDIKNTFMISSEEKQGLEEFIRYYNGVKKISTWTKSPVIGGSDFVIVVNNNLDIINLEQLIILFTVAKKTNNFSYLPSIGKYSETWVVRNELIGEEIANIGSLPQKCLGANQANYLKAARNNIRDTAKLLKILMSANLQSISQPESVVFEFANVCNLACPICPRNDRKIADGLMDLTLAKNIVKNIAEVNDTVTFYPHYLGETLIHPDFLQLIDYALEFEKLSINIVSNGILLTEKMTNELLARELHNFHFSLHECDTYGQAGVHPSRAISSKNVVNFLLAAEKTNRRKKIRVQVSMCPVRLDEPAVDIFREYWQDVVDAVNIYSYVAPDRTYLDEELNKSFNEINLPCSSPWKQPVIAYDGTVLPCCWDYDHTMPMGNAFETEFTKIYDGTKFQHLRDSMLSGSLMDYPTCYTCKKWLDYLPSFPQVEMEKYIFSSNGLYLSYATKKVMYDRPAIMLSEFKMLDKSHVPFHKKTRPQAKKTFKKIS